MTEDVAIRPARLSDANGIADVHIETWREAYAGVIQDSYLLELDAGVQARAWQRDIVGRRPGAGILVATVKGARREQVVGFGSWGRCRSAALPYAGEVYMLYILNDWQGRGVGRRMLGALFRQIARSERNSAFLWVLSANPARFFYDAMGGRPVAERQESFAGSLLDETAYAWPDLTHWLASQRHPLDER